MKYFTVLGFLLGSTFSIAFSQSTRTMVPANALKSEHPNPQVNSSMDKNLTTDKKETSGVQFLEYKAEERNDLVNSEATLRNQADDQKNILPIMAEGYTDPNYELNKQKSIEVTLQLQAPAVIPKTNEELILDLQTKIKAIKEGGIVSSDATTKLPLYEKELQLLLNTKQTKSCVTE